VNKTKTTENTPDAHIKQCLQLIERKLGWGDSARWGNYDFSKLSAEVHQRTQVRLSVTTLKRIWGKVKYDSAPATTTLNALALFAGYEDWRHFSQHNLTEGLETVDAFSANSPEQDAGHYKRVNRFWFLLAIPFVVISCFFILSARKPGRLNPGAFEFRANKVVAEGVPNSVVFHYDASAAATDSVFIVQTWDIRRKKLVSRVNHEHSAMYYYPGFFNTKLIADGQVVRTHDLFVTSNGWLCLVEQEPVPLYFKKDECVFDDRVEVNADLLKKYNLSLNPTPPRIRFFNQRDLGDIMNDNFVFETTLKNEFSEGSGACQFVQVLIQCKDDIIIIPLSAKTCIGEMNLYFCGKEVNSGVADLSKFGADLNQWTKLRVESVNRDVSLFVNGEKAYTLTFPNNPTGVVGVQYRFNGVGAVKDTWFESKGEMIRL
jgi:hypothetical protein